MFSACRSILNFGHVVVKTSNRVVCVKKIVNVNNYYSTAAISVNEALNTIIQSTARLVTVNGWVRSVREHKEVVFLHINDGSSQSPLQIVTTHSRYPSEASFGSCVEVVGSLVKSEMPNQAVEINAETIRVIGSCDLKDYPLKSRKRHPLDYLRQHLHLRPRTLTFAALLRTRNVATQAIHEYFQREGFCQIHTPILTCNDCEGAGEIFEVEPADKTYFNKGNSDELKHFFGAPTYLTVSGQLHLEVVAGAFSKVYTFGPTFRAENSRTRHHLAEFYMIEAEMAFIKTIDEIIETVENLLKFTVQTVLEKCQQDVAFFMDNIAVKGHTSSLDLLLKNPFIRMSYSDAVSVLEKHKSSFRHDIAWGKDLQKEHERFLVRHCGGVPVFVVDYPSAIKPFYAKVNEDSKTVAALDLLASDVGEICGGSLREDRLDVLERRLADLSIDPAGLDWYLDLRRFGSAPHGGFGIGFERILQTILGIQNIKDTIPFPRSVNNCHL